MYAVEEASNLRTRLNLPDVSRYVTKGSYYNYNSNNGFEKNDNKINKVLDKIVKLIDTINSKNNMNELEGLKIELPIYLDNTLLTVLSNEIHPIISNNMALKTRGRR